MRFEFQGNEYRIVFRHDPSRELSAHVGHNVFLGPAIQDGHVILCCNDCREPGSSEYALTLYPVGKNQSRRQTHVSIEFLLGKCWIPLIKSSSRVNAKAGDKFNRNDGREAALANAVGDCMVNGKGTFGYHVWRCYFSRKPSQRAAIEALGL